MCQMVLTFLSQGIPPPFPLTGFVRVCLPRDSPVRPTSHQVQYSTGSWGVDDLKLGGGLSHPTPWGKCWNLEANLEQVGSWKGRFLKKCHRIPTFRKS